MGPEIGDLNRPFDNYARYQTVNPNDAIANIDRMFQVNSPFVSPKTLGYAQENKYFDLNNTVFNTNNYDDLFTDINPTQFGNVQYNDDPFINQQDATYVDNKPTPIATETKPAKPSKAASTVNLALSGVSLFLGVQGIKGVIKNAKKGATLWETTKNVLKSATTEFIKPFKQMGNFIGKGLTKITNKLPILKKAGTLLKKGLGLLKKAWPLIKRFVQRFVLKFLGKRALLAGLAFIPGIGQAAMLAIGIVSAVMLVTDVIGGVQGIMKSGKELTA